MEKEPVNSAPKRLVVIGGSAGSLQVILHLMDALPVTFKIPVLVVLHRDPLGASRLSEIFAQRAKVPVKEVEDKEELEAGTVYVCPADYHALPESDNTISLDYSEKEHYSRPSIDVAFRAAADAHQESLICILLSGANADGADGMYYAHRQGATTIVQEPADALVAYMPEQALLVVEPTYIMPEKDIIAFIASLS